MSAVGARIRQARISKGITQAELAKRLGVAYQNIGQWESEKRTPRIETLMKIGKALDVPWVWFTRPELFEHDFETAQTEYNKTAEQNRVHKAFFAVLEAVYGKSTEHVIHGEYGEERYWVYDNSGDPFALMSDDIEVVAEAACSVTKTLVKRFAVTEEETEVRIKEIQREESRLVAESKGEDFPEAAQGESSPEGKNTTEE